MIPLNKEDGREATATIRWMLSRTIVVGAVGEGRGRAGGGGGGKGARGGKGGSECGNQPGKFCVVGAGCGV